MEAATILNLSLLLLIAKIGGEIAQRINLPPVFGEIMGGLFIGPNILGIIPAHSEFLVNISGFALLIMLFRIGLEVNIKKMVQFGRQASTISLFGILFTFFLGYLWGWTNLGLPLGDVKRNLLLGLILSASSVGISARVLADMEKIHLKEATLILESAVIDDVIGLLVFSLIISWITSGHASLVALLPTILKIFAFLFGTLWLGRLIIPKLMVLTLGMVSRESALIFAIILALITGYFAEISGLAAIAGTLLMGIIIAETPRADNIRERIEPLYNVFVPLFFVMIGITVDLSNLGNILLGGIVITVIAIVGKVIGCGFGALMSGFNQMEALRIGIGMIPRAEVPLVIATLATTQFTPKLISWDLYGMVIVMTLTTTLVTSVLLKMVFVGDDYE